MNKVLDVQNLHVSFDTYAGEVKAVRGVTFSLSEGEVLAIVGESGCGKQERHGADHHEAEPHAARKN